MWQPPTRAGRKSFSFGFPENKRQCQENGSRRRRGEGGSWGQRRVEATVEAGRVEELALGVLEVRQILDADPELDEPPTKRGVGVNGEDAWRELTKRQCPLAYEIQPNSERSCENAPCDTNPGDGAEECGVRPGHPSRDVRDELASVFEGRIGVRHRGQFIHPQSGCPQCADESPATGGACSRKASEGGVEDLCI